VLSIWAEWQFHGPPPSSIFPQVFILGGFKSLFLQLLISRDLVKHLVQVLNLRDLNFPAHRREGDCHCIRNKSNWRFMGSRRANFLERCLTRVVPVCGVRWIPQDPCRSSIRSSPILGVAAWRSFTAERGRQGGTAHTDMYGRRVSILPRASNPRAEPEEYHPGVCRSTGIG
jgi:hypothetical protein